MKVLCVKVSTVLSNLAQFTFHKIIRGVPEEKHNTRTIGMKVSSMDGRVKRYVAI